MKFRNWFILFAFFGNASVYANASDVPGGHEEEDAFLKEIQLAMIEAEELKLSVWLDSLELAHCIPQHIASRIRNLIKTEVDRIRKNVHSSGVLAREDKIIVDSYAPKLHAIASTYEKCLHIDVLINTLEKTRRITKQSADRYKAQLDQMLNSIIENILNDRVTTLEDRQKLIEFMIRLELPSSHERMVRARNLVDHAKARVKEFMDARGQKSQATVSNEPTQTVPNEEMYGDFEQVAEAAAEAAEAEEDNSPLN